MRIVAGGIGLHERVAAHHVSGTVDFSTLAALREVCVCVCVGGQAES